MTTKRQDYRTPLTPEAQHRDDGGGRKKKKRRRKEHREIDEDDPMTRPRVTTVMPDRKWEPIGGGARRKKVKGQDWIFV